jgi:hypothetical protein
MSTSIPSKEYPPTMMPEEVTAFWGSGHHTWTKKQRETYFKWYLDILDWRIQRLLDYFDEDLSGSPEEILDRLGNKVAAVLPDSYFTYDDDDGRRL